MKNAGFLALEIKAKENYNILARALEEIEKKFVGNEDFVKDVILSLISGESILVKAEIGSGKEYFVKTLKEISGLASKTFYLTNDSEIPKLEELDTNILLLENYKKAPEKVQAFFANLVNKKEAYDVEMNKPFIVIATYKEGENFDLESLDKFAISTEINFPDKYEEMEILERETKGKIIEIKQVISDKIIEKIKGFVRGIHMDEELNERIVEFVQELRKNTDSVITPRTTVQLILAAKGNALLEERGNLVKEDIKEVLMKVFGHRIFNENKEELILEYYKTKIERHTL